MFARQSSFIRQLIQSDFSVPRRRFQDGERVIAGIHQMTPILRGLDSVGTREGEASSAVLIWIAPTLLEPSFAANRRSAERRVGHECVRTCRSRWSADPYTKTNAHIRQT